MLDKIKNQGIFLINTNKTGDEILAKMKVKDKRILQSKHIKMYIIDADKIAKENNLNGKISSIMETLIFKLGKIIDYNFAVNQIKDNLKIKFANKSGNIINNNIAAIDACLQEVKQVKIPDVDYDEIIEKKKTDFEIINCMEGDILPVSKFIKIQMDNLKVEQQNMKKEIHLIIYLVIIVKTVYHVIYVH